MVYPKNFESKIEFDVIREMLKEYCLSTLGKRFVDKLHFIDNYDLINKLLSQADELKQAITIAGRFPEQDYFDLTPELTRLNIEGTFIETQALFDLKTSLNTIIECIVFIKKLDKTKYPFLRELVVNSYQLPATSYQKIVIKIDEIIDDKGKIKDTASAELAGIRHSLQTSAGNVEKRINQFFSNLKKQGLAPENESVTIRNGRLVIPILASNKRKLKGIIQDESASGMTVFMEPEEIIEMNNDIKKLEFEERREIIKILTQFTDFIRPQIETLISSYHFLGIIDFIRAKVKFAIATNSVKPKLLNVPSVKWLKAMHPLLYLRHNTQDTRHKTTPQLSQQNDKALVANERQQKKVVSNDITLNNKQRILLISGPNAGGKSVLLKTAGLLQYMIQCGMLVPMAEHSEAGIFKNLFIDIGDEQSIENDLSTYSSHLMNIKYFINNADKKTLFLIDEFGSGTEPQIGGAIAEASLEELNHKLAFGIVTTHYTNLKLLATQTEGLVNGSMLFDAKKLAPSYQLKTGMMGSSYAFEIAKKIGFNKAVLLNAEKKTGTKQVDFEKQLLEVEAKKKEIEQKEKEITAADDTLAEVVQKYKKLTDEIEKKKKTIIEDAKKNAEEILAGSNKIIEKTIKEIRESQADKEKTKKLREALENEKQKVKTVKPETITTSISNRLKRAKKESRENRDRDLKGETIKRPVKTSSKNQVSSIKTTPPLTPPQMGRGKKSKQETEIPDTIRNINKGDYIRAKGKTAIGQVIEIYSDEAIVAFSSFNMGLSLKELEKVEQNIVHSRENSTSRSIMKDLNMKAANFKTTLDVRGKRVDEALSLVQKYIDDAILLRIMKISILHGKGNGILRQVIRDYLRSVDEIKEYKDEKLEQGGDGVTSVVFK